MDRALGEPTHGGDGSVRGLIDSRSMSQILVTLASLKLRFFEQSAISHCEASALQDWRVQSHDPIIWSAFRSTVPQLKLEGLGYASL